MQIRNMQKYTRYLKILIIIVIRQHKSLFRFCLFSCVHKNMNLHKSLQSSYHISEITSVKLNIKPTRGYAKICRSNFIGIMKLDLLECSISYGDIIDCILINLFSKFVLFEQIYELQNHV